MWTKLEWLNIFKQEELTKWKNIAQCFIQKWSNMKRLEKWKRNGFIKRCRLTHYYKNLKLNHFETFSSSLDRKKGRDIILVKPFFNSLIWDKNMKILCKKRKRYRILKCHQTKICTINMKQIDFLVNFKTLRETFVRKNAKLCYLLSNVNIFS